MSEPPAAVRYVTRDGARLACAYTQGSAPTVVFLGGYGSDMSGSKALHLEACCRARGQAYLRLDYQGHGQSSGNFEDGDIGVWAADARHVIEAVTDGPLLLVGSSMGGWIMLLVAREMRARVCGLVGIAAAPDFSEDMLEHLDGYQKSVLERDGLLRMPSVYSDQPLVVTRRFIEEGRRYLQLRSVIGLDCPVRLLHGLDDPDVPWRVSLALAEHLRSPDVQVVLVKGAGHRLSAPAELDLIAGHVAALS